MAKNFEISSKNNNVSVIKYSGKKSDPKKFFIFADGHWDNPHCDRDLLKNHLDKAKEENIPIISCGDFFCAMQGKYDKRSNKESLRDEHKTDEYFDSLVDTAADWLEPYVDNLAVIGDGNHETSIKKRSETNLTKRLVKKLQCMGSKVQLGGYGGWIRFYVKDTANFAQSFVLYYHHGFGGGGPVTQGKIDFNRYRGHVDSDIIVSGHVHYKEAFPNTVAYLSNKNVVKQKNVWCIRCGSYKNEYKDGSGGFHIEQGRGPRPLGGYFVEIYWSNRTESYHIKPVPSEE